MATSRMATLRIAPMRFCTHEANFKRSALKRRAFARLASPRDPECLHHSTPVIWEFSVCWAIHAVTRTAKHSMSRRHLVVSPDLRGWPSRNKHCTTTLDLAPITFRGSYGPEVYRRLHGEVKRKSSTWHMDEPFVRIAGKWMYLFRAVDSQGQTVDF